MAAHRVHDRKVAGHGSIPALAMRYCALGEDTYFPNPRMAVRSEFAYHVSCTFNRTVPAYRSSVQFLKSILRTLPWYGTFFCVPYLQSIWLNNDPLMTYATYVDVFFCLFRVVPKDKLKSLRQRFLKRVNRSTRVN